MITYSEAISREPLVCSCDSCGYPHPHCVCCSGALLWDADKGEWQHTNECAFGDDWELHTARSAGRL